MENENRSKVVFGQSGGEACGDLDEDMWGFEGGREEGIVEVGVRMGRKNRVYADALSLDFKRSGTKALKLLSAV